MAKIVLALGGNALGSTPEEQLFRVTETAKSIVDLATKGNEVIVVHGNGPQVGMINTGLATAAEVGEITAAVPLPECGAMSQGYIGYHLQNSIQNELKARGKNKSAVTVITQVLVDENDQAFANPTKPIGAFYSKSEAMRIQREKGYTFVEDANRGYRQVVPSPKPIDVIEKEAVAALLDAGQIVITLGGGGIPVVRRDGKLVGIPAVIDKDYASAKLAELIKADILIILTAVERVAVNFGKPDQRLLSFMNLEEAQKYIDEGQFAPGSMLPKVQAATGFVATGGKAIIASLKNADHAINGQSGTVITGHGSEIDEDLFGT